MCLSVTEDPKPDTIEVEVQNSAKDVEARDTSMRIMIHAQQQARIRRKVSMMPFQPTVAFYSLTLTLRDSLV